MTADVASQLALVVDYQFGERLLPLARSMPVYVVTSPQNSAAVDAAWNELSSREGFLTAFGATGFQANQADLDEVIAEQLEFIESVHGYEGGERPYTRLHIYGVRGSDALDAVLAEYGFLHLEPTDYGLFAER